jgi:pimeloyl-ACP methyl ester carboxylesterase
VADWLRDLVAVLDEVGARRPVLLASEDTVSVAFTLAGVLPRRLGGIVVTNAYARFTRGGGYPHGLDPQAASRGVAQVTSARPGTGDLDLLRMIAPSVAGDDRFRCWWDEAGRRGASPQVARALRERHQNDDLRPLLPRVRVPVLHLVNPHALTHDTGHDRYLEAHLPRVETCELPGPDELWWLDRSGELLARVERFVRERAT